MAGFNLIIYQSSRWFNDRSGMPQYKNTWHCPPKHINSRDAFASDKNVANQQEPLFKVHVSRNFLKTFVRFQFKKTVFIISQIGCREM